jgi:hypothetical protein
MTFKLHNVETISFETALGLIKKREGNNFVEIIPFSIIDEFVEHDIFHLNNGLLYFHKKKLRLFFTALYLKDKISSFSDFEKYKYGFLKYSKNKDSWEEIQNFLVGLVCPLKIFKYINEITFDNSLNIDLKLIERFELYLNFVSQKNTTEYYKKSDSNIIKYRIEIIISVLTPIKQEYSFKFRLLIMRLIF